MATRNLADIETSLKAEYNFSFNKTNVPQKLIPLLDEIENNKRKWKSLYMAVWGLPLHFLEPAYINKSQGDKLIPWGLPAAKLGRVLYTPKELKKYLTNYDPDIHISQLIKIFTLLEDYMFEYHKITNNHQKLDFTIFRILAKCIKENAFATEKEISELEYAKETRNSFVHRRGLVDNRLLKAYKKTNRKDSLKIGEIISINFHDLEDWSDILIKIIEKSLKRYRP